MKVLFLTLLFVSCVKTNSIDNCKVVRDIGGCDEYYCGVKFEDGTFTPRADRPVVGATMCKRGSSWYIQE